MVSHREEEKKIIYRKWKTFFFIVLLLLQYCKFVVGKLKVQKVRFSYMAFFMVSKLYPKIPRVSHDDGIYCSYHKIFGNDFKIT